MRLRVLPSALLLLAIPFLASGAFAAQPVPELPVTCTGTPGVCVFTGHPCAGVAVRTGATDFYPGAGVCSVRPPAGYALCEGFYAGVGTLGGFYGPHGTACVGGSDVFRLCAGALGNAFDPVCL